MTRLARTVLGCARAASLREKRYRERGKDEIQRDKDKSK
jgi:hypothetical protein